MRGPGASTYSDEAETAEEVLDVIGALAEAGIEIKLGQIPDEQRARLVSLTNGQVQALRRHKTDILRVLLAKALVAEAQEIRRLWAIPDHRTHAAGRRYGDLLFSARALLPPGVDWDAVTYESLIDGKVCWSHQLAYDRGGKKLEGVTYSNTEAEQLLEEFKGPARDPEEEDEDGPAEALAS